MITAKLESMIFGDYSKKVVLPNEIITAYENTCYTDDNIVIDYVLSKCKTFRKYGKHLNEKFIIWFE